MMKARPSRRRRMMGLLAALAAATWAALGTVSVISTGLANAAGPSPIAVTPFAVSTHYSPAPRT